MWDIHDVDEEIAELNDGMVLLCTDEDTFDDDTDELEESDAHLLMTHDDTYVISDAHAHCLVEQLAVLSSP